MIVSCNPIPDYSDTPELTFKSVSKDTMNQGLNSDTVFVVLGFTDGDGDITITDLTQNPLNLEVRDMRTGQKYDRFKIPEIPISGASNGISGDITIMILNACCIFPDIDPLATCEVIDGHPTNILVWEFTLTDNAGNISEPILSSQIELKCR